MTQPNSRNFFRMGPELLEQVRAQVRVEHDSYRAEQEYVYWIKRFILFHNKLISLKTGEIEMPTLADDNVALWNCGLPSNHKPTMAKLIWEGKYEAVQALGLTERIVDENSQFPNIGKSFVEIMNL